MKAVNNHLYIILSIIIVSAAGCDLRDRIPEPPRAEQKPHEVVAPRGHVRVDEYYWLRERENPEVIRYLEDENAYTDAVMGHTAGLQETLFNEIVGRIQETDMSVPYKFRNYWYYTLTEEGKDYPIYARRKGTMEAPEEVFLDANQRAEEKSFYRVSWQVSPGEDILAFAEDTLGRNIVTVRFKNLQTGELLDDIISGVSWNMVWAEDNRTLFYTARDPVTLRTDRVYRHELGSDPADAKLVYEETDETFTTYVFKTSSREYVVIGSSQTIANEFRYVRADRPRDQFRVFLPRERGHEHSIDHAGDYFYIRTNDNAKNFRLVRTPENRTGREHWRDVIPHRDDVLVHGFELFRNHLAVRERSEGQVRIRVRTHAGGDDYFIGFDEEVYSVYPMQNVEFDTEILRLGYSSPATPFSVYDYDMNTRELTLLKREEVLGEFDPADYRTERHMATARDGTLVPVTMVYHRDLRRNGPQPLLLYGYGSYGASMDPWFSSQRLSLLDRGIIYATAHIRGGQELGRDWYEDGRLFNKKNTFYDFIDVAEYLVDEGYTSPDRLYAEGASAGGLLIGAVVNMRPDLFHGAISGVPFVDVITTMLDEDIPLTSLEYDEWGDPRDPEQYEYILSYSPYDNVTEQDYPNLLITTGLHDSQCQYWEAAKWTARLRDNNTGDNIIMLKTNMDAGHGGASGRYQNWREIAFRYAFILDLAGLADL